jgi:3-hydroxyacyl-CoA dehydrogenase/3-hydroxy-2-methylbutyryl-CoA dehydrogenase
MLQNRVDNLAGWFQAKGIKRGEKVAILLYNSIQYTECFFALAAVYFKTNVTGEEDVQHAINSTIAQFGSINTVVNWAGIGNAEKTVSRNKAHGFDSFKKVIEINLIGTFNVIRLAAEKLVTNQPNQEGERGVIINTASVAAFDVKLARLSRINRNTIIRVAF